MVPASMIFGLLILLSMRAGTTKNSIPSPNTTFTDSRVQLLDLVVLVKLGSLVSSQSMTIKHPTLVRQHFS